jgi:hypothetical protein
MMDVHELLIAKENDLIRIRKEIEALRLVAPLLSDSEVSVSQTELDSAATQLSVEINGAPETPSQDQSQPDEASSEPIPPKRTLRDWFSRAAGE